MIGCLGQSRTVQSRAAQDSDVVARAVAAVALAVLAVIHVVVATLKGAIIVVRSH
jgi:hypothetical protein